MSKPTLSKKYENEVVKGFKGNPVPLVLVVKLVGVIVRLLRDAGVPQLLRDKATESDNQVDDILANIVATVIERIAEL